ncbi:hypothetical protein GCM10010420_33450 [Streptomyces glaucosporus]|uniref:DNA-binding protein n=1 Tax=Streptomyces glaucosporus TaxID=284044 RepID=A0ABP5VJT3_9ACTN
MADPQFSAPSRARAEAPSSGVIHVRTRLTTDFTVLANVLLQRPGSAVTVGVAAYIASLPDGAPVSIAALCEHFSEGEILISRALRELEAAGCLERRRERGPMGRVRTRTYFHDVPHGDAPAPVRPARRARRPEPGAVPAPAPLPAPSPAPAAPVPAAPVPAAPVPAAPAPAAPASDAPAPDAVPAFPPQAGADPRAVALLASLRAVDPRLVLTGTEAARLAPAVTRWLAAGVAPARITEALTTGLPDRLRARPSAILAFRLAEPPLPVPAPAPPPAGPAVLPFQTCDGYERAFRAAVPGLCRDCRAGTGDVLPAAC